MWGEMTLCRNAFANTRCVISSFTGQGMSLYRIARQAHAGCMVCGDVGCNPDSLGLEFVHAADGVVTASFPVTSRHQGYDGLLHGGMIGTLLDAAMTHCLFAQGIRALTAEMTVRFIAPVETGSNVMLTARLLGQTHGIYRLESEMFLEKQLLARASAKFVKPKNECWSALKTATEKSYLTVR